MTQNELKTLFEYKDGKLFWRHKTMKEAGSSRVIKNKTYRQITYQKHTYLIHRLIYLYHYGFLPTIVDHIDRDTINNNIENLRAATYKTNNQNARAKNTNTSGYKNVNWNKNKNKWRVTLNIKGKNNFFGYYDDIELADLVAIEARNKYHGSFACHAI